MAARFSDKRHVGRRADDRGCGEIRRLLSHGHGLTAFDDWGRSNADSSD